jgi:hypothetical protein
MTYRALILALIDKGNPGCDDLNTRLDSDVTVRDSEGEFFQVIGIGISKEGDAADGILDRGHLYLEINE